MTSNGLHVQRTLICPCGATFATKNPGGRYCSSACRIKYGRFGRTYGVVVPRALGVTK